MTTDEHPAAKVEVTNTEQPCNRDGLLPVRCPIGTERCTVHTLRPLAPGETGGPPPSAFLQHLL